MSDNKIPLSNTITSEVNNNIISLSDHKPNIIHILPISNSPIFPGIITPITIKSKKIIKKLKDDKININYIGLVLVKSEPKNKKDPVTSKNIYRVGTLVKIIKIINLPSGWINIIVNSIRRFYTTKFIKDEDYDIIAEVKYSGDDSTSINEKIEIKALERSILQKIRIISENNSILMEQVKLTLANIEGASKIGDFAASLLKLKNKEYQKILQEFNLEKRLCLILRYLEIEVKVNEIQKTIQSNIELEIDKKQREYFLKEQLSAIKKELNLDESPHTQVVKLFKKKIDKINVTNSIKEQISQELEKFSLLEPQSSEYIMTKNYLDLVTALPWNKKSKDPKDIKKSEKILNQNHYGLQGVKDRILEFLAVKQLKKDSTNSSIICLLGPPGVGKTSLGKSIAKSLNRRFYRFSLGGMRDEAEIKGHRRTYIGAMPGKILMALKTVKYNNPVIMLDEIDKVGNSYLGDPSSALLEVLDPEQNIDFIDNYLDLPFDLSDVLFITTANTLDSIQRPLLDRMEVIKLSGYIEEEKYFIVKNYLFPKQLEAHGIDKSKLKINNLAYKIIIDNYTRESGLRGLERCIKMICRKRTLEVLKNSKYNITITPKNIKEYLGIEKYRDNNKNKTSRVGEVNGLAWTSYGGTTLTIEAINISSTSNDMNNIKLTGQLGSVMNESANIAYSFIKNLVYDKYNEKFEVFNKNNIHLHVPEGATPKDGPSAGITMATCILSLVLNRPIPNHIGMTGELTLLGDVLAIGGLKEKLIAAKRNKLTLVIVPFDNKKDLEEIPEHIHSAISMVFIKHFSDLLSIIGFDTNKNSDS